MALARTNTPPPSDPEQLPPLEALDTIIDLKVGPEAASKSFFVHKGLAIFYSGFLRAATTSKFAEAASGVVTLPTQDPDTMAAFVTWIYFRRLPRLTTEDASFKNLLKLWLLADALRVPMLGNVVLNYFGTRSSRPPGHPPNF